jgi:hypothetical protein
MNIIEVSSNKNLNDKPRSLKRYVLYWIFDAVVQLICAILLFHDLVNNSATATIAISAIMNFAFDFIVGSFLWIFYHCVDHDASKVEFFKHQMILLAIMCLYRIFFLCLSIDTIARYDILPTNVIYIISLISIIMSCISLVYSGVLIKIIWTEVSRLGFLQKFDRI